jgi:dGTPase
MVTDVVEQSVRRPDAPEIGMSAEVLEATLTLREFLFAAVYEDDAATAEFGKVAGMLESLWGRVRSEPARFLDRATLERDGIDVASRDFLAGMTDRFAIGLFEELFVPRSWGERSGYRMV